MPKPLTLLYPTQIQAVIEANLIPPIISLMSIGDFKTKKEA